MKPVGSAFQSRALRAPAVDERRRVKTYVAVLMGALAFLFDALQFFISFLNVIPVVGNAIAFASNWFIAAFAYSIFYLVWFPLLGVKLTDGKPGKFVNMLFSAVIEATPLLDALPGITYGVISTVIYSRVEDAIYNKAHKMEIRRAQERAQKKEAQRARQAAFIDQQNALIAANDNAQEEEREESAQEAA
jgi:hypothetical protein